MNSNRSAKEQRSPAKFVSLTIGQLDLGLAPGISIISCFSHYLSPYRSVVQLDLALAFRSFPVSVITCLMSPYRSVKYTIGPSPDISIISCFSTTCSLKNGKKCFHGNMMVLLKFLKAL